MLKRKFKILFLLIAIITLVSTLSFATIEPRTSEEDYEAEITSIEDEIMNAEDNYDDEIMPISEEDQSISDEEEWINSDLYIMQDKYELNKIVDGNVFIFANEVTINSQIGGDAFIFANKLTINSDAYIYSTLFVAASEVTINSGIGDVYAVCDNFTLKENGFIGRDLKVSANKFNLYGKVSRDVYVSAANYNISEQNAPLIGGNFNYSGKSEITIPEGLILGEVKYNKETVAEESVIEKVSDYIFDGINVLVYALVVVLLAIWLAPKFVQRISSMDTKKAFISLGIGIVAPIVAIIALFMLLVSSVASMLSVSGIFIFIAICMSGTAFASIYFGSILVKITKWEGKIKFVLASLISTLIIWIISQLPFIGSIFGFLIALFGIGTLILNVVYRKEVIAEVNETKE